MALQLWMGGLLMISKFFYMRLFDTCVLLHNAWDTGFNVEQMQARTIKVEKAKTMSHSRPITILGHIYRLMTKIAADQISAVWALWLPPTISGGIPGRGSRMLMLAHQCRLEQSMLQKANWAVLCWISSKPLIVYQEDH